MPGAETTSAARVDRVGQWQRFEVAIYQPVAYDDAYRDVNLDAVYTRPDGSTVAFWGFYDGDGLWRCRFMPDQLGRWHYAAGFSDGSGVSTGSFDCVPSDVPGVVDVYAPNPIWFGYRDDGPVLLRSLHVGDGFFARNFDADRRAAFLDWAEAQGYNLLSIASHYLNRATPGRGLGWKTPQLWPLDAAAYRELETVLDDLAARRMMVFPFAGFFGRDAHMPVTASDQARYVRYTVARLGPYWNVLFNVGGPEPLLRHAPYLSEADVNRLGALLKESDPFGHLLTVHNPTGDDAFRDEDWLDFSTLQGPKTQDLETLSAGLLRNHHADKPLYAQETLWSGNTYHPDYSDEVLRRNAFVMLFSGAMINFADNGGPEPGTVGDSSSGFTGTMDLQDCRQHRHDILRAIWDLFETLPYHRLSPRQDLVDRGYCLAAEADTYLVYLPRDLDPVGDKGGVLAVNVAVRPGAYRVTWISTQDATVRRDGGWTKDGGGLAAPGDGADWLVMIRADQLDDVQIT